MTIHDEAEKLAAVIAATANHISNSDAHFPIPVDGIYSAADIIRTLSARLREAEARPAVRVKPLVWERLSSGTLRADIYRVKSTYGMGPKAFILVRASIVLGHFDDDVSAMAVGDADHEAHILAAVEAVDLTHVREALEKMLHAVCGDTGFAACVRQDSGYAYPWPALEEAEACARAALALLDGRTWDQMPGRALITPEMRDALEQEQGNG